MRKHPALTISPPLMAVKSVRLKQVYAAGMGTACGTETLRKPKADSAVYDATIRNRMIRPLLSCGWLGVYFGDCAAYVGHTEDLCTQAPVSVAPGAVSAGRGDHDHANPGHRTSATRTPAVDG